MDPLLGRSSPLPASAASLACPLRTRHCELASDISGRELTRPAAALVRACAILSLVPSAVVRTW